jgi:diguanylate cyclase (GGDEF)-like protein/PAS domain S-box-containing protein
MRMKNWWQSLGIAAKLNIPIQVVLFIVFSFAQSRVMEYIKGDILDGAERRAEVLADGVINGMNMLMLTGMISNPDNRLLFIKKMGSSENVKELRIVRAKQVQDQFGPGLPEEQTKDDMDRHAMELKRPQFRLTEDPSSPTLRAVVPFIVSTHFRGTNCLVCHHVEVGSVNGAASITLDISEEIAAIRRTNTVLVVGQIALQILLFFSIHWMIRRLIKPLVKLQSTMDLMRRRGSVDIFTPIEVGAGEQDEIGKLTSAFNQMAESLFESEKSMRLSALIYRSNADAIVVTDEHNHIVDINPAFTRITGYTQDEVMGRDPKLMQSGRHDKEFYRQMWHAILNEGHWEGELWDMRKNGEVYAKLAHITVLRRTDGSIYRHVAQFSDITEKKQKDDLIYWQANYDPLTSLPNRRLFNERLAHTLVAGRRNRLYGALMFLDMDKFKALNDTLGHEFGDMLLIEVANRLKSNVRDVDTVARLGGDEFVVLIENISEEAEDASLIIANVAEKLRAALAETYRLKQYEYHSSPSIGVYLYNGDSGTADDVLKRADMAMYQAKESGRNAVRFFDPDMQKSVETRTALESDLRRAIPERQFDLYYQIQVDNDHRPIGAEALIRWNHPTRGQVSPSEFIPFAEGSPLILEIGHWVLDAACRQLAAWRERAHTRPLVLAVNISAQQFKQPDFVLQVAALIEKHGIDPARLKLELTESVSVGNVDSVAAQMRTLRETLNVTLSLDDFGTGYSSLSHLKRLPLDQVKIDRSFVRDITTNQSDAVMVKTIINMAQNFGLHVIAEGIETDAQLAHLKQYGCMAYQGFLFAQPLPLEQFEALLSSGKLSEI